MDGCWASGNRRVPPERREFRALWDGTGVMEVPGLHSLHRSLLSLSWIAQRARAWDLVWLVTGMSSVVALVSCAYEIAASLPRRWVAAYFWME